MHLYTVAKRKSTASHIIQQAPNDARVTVRLLGRETRLYYFKTFINEEHGDIIW